ncbi:Cysteine--tRNA ligase [Buchnera aphidicola (Pterocallis alni)]|uniref:cysteine--tRNA ligase n=1 Tax=Buchnera aphidicola TaxID=9 RepID=UPI00346426E2
MLKIFNTITKKKEYFNTIFLNIVNMYVCGVTVYDHCHIGHARTFTVFDMIIRYLKHQKYKVNYVRNITDIDDKIIKRSELNKESIFDLTVRMIYSMHMDFSNLGLIKPTFEPRITHYINYIIYIIKKLLHNKNAYISSNGDVVFSVLSYRNYGNLSKQLLSKLKSNNFNHSKKLEYDFVLWKKVKLSNQPHWTSPWGPGRPGWHIECSAINHAFFGKHLDIHGGGSDLLFPHHENEKAQSNCLYNSSYGNYWIHVGSLLVNNKKMSKSLNNTIYLNSLLKKYNSEIIRFFFLCTHYRKPLLYNQNNLIQNSLGLKRLYLVLSQYISDTNPFISKFQVHNSFFCTRFYDAMNDDFNTPKAISILFELCKEINILLKAGKKNHSIKLMHQLKFLSNSIGLLKQNPIDFLRNFL